MIVKWATWGFVLGRTTYHLAMRAARSASGSGRSDAPQPPSPSLPAVESKHSDEPPDSAPSADTADPLKFFLLVFGLTIPFYVFGLSPCHSDRLPASALMVLNRVPPPRPDFRKTDVKNQELLIAPSSSTNPQRVAGSRLLSFGDYLPHTGQRLTGAPLPEPKIPFQNRTLFGLYLIPAAGEELVGWYA